MPISFTNLSKVKKAVQPQATQPTAPTTSRADPNAAAQLRQALASPNTDQDVKAYNATGNTGAVKATSVMQPATYNRANEGQAAQPTDFTSNIRQLYGDRLTSANNAVDYAAQNTINQLNRQAETLSQQYQPQRNQASVSGAQNLRTALEMAANAGDRGGVGRQNALLTQTSMQNQINDINLQEQNARNEIQNAIADAIAQRDFQKAQNIAENSSALIEAIMNENIRNQTRQDALTQQGFNNRIAEAGLTGMYGGNQTIQAQSQALQDAISLAGITGTYNGQQTLQGQLTQSQIESQNLQNAYQSLVNAGYSEMQSAQLAQILAQTAGQGLQNQYQALVNAGLPAQQAAELAQTYAQTANINANTANTQANTASTLADGGIDTKVYTPKGQTIPTSQVTQRLDDMLAMGASKDQLAQIISTMYNNQNISKQLVNDLQRKYGLY